MAQVLSKTPGRDDGQVFEVVHAKMLQFFPELAESLGGDPAQLMRQVGIEAPGSAEVTYRQVLDLLELAASELDCPDLGMRLASLQSGRMMGPLGAVMTSSRTFGEALEYVSRHGQAHSLAARIWLRWAHDRAEVFAGHDILLDHAPHRSQSIEHILLVGHLAVMEMTGGAARVRRVYFRHQPVSPLKVYRRYFGCDVLFGEDVDGVVYFERDMAAPIVARDASVYAAATALVDARFSRQRSPLHAQVRGLVMQLLGGGRCRAGRVADELKLHPQTMLRRLKAEGTSFQKIKDEVRHDLMIYYLQRTDLDLGRISERLGFAEQSVMTRTCNKWFSVSPTRLRAARSERATND